MAIDQNWFIGRMKDAGLSQRKLSTMFSNSPGTMSAILLGNRNLQLEEVPVVAQALGVTVEELIRRLGISLPVAATDRSQTVPVSGIVSETAVIEEGRQAHRAPRPDNAPKALSAIVMQSQTGDGPHQGYTYYVEDAAKDRPVDATSLNALCVVQIGDHSATRHLGVVQRSVEPGRFNVINPFTNSPIVNGVQIRNAQPVVWIKTTAA